MFFFFQTKSIYLNYLSDNTETPTADICTMTQALSYATLSELELIPYSSTFPDAVD